EDEKDNISVFNDLGKNNNAINQLREITDKNGIISISKNPITVNGWIGNGAVVFYPDTGSSDDILYYNDSFSNGGSSTDFYKADYFVDMMLTSVDVGLTIAGIVAILGGAIASPLLAGVIIGALFIAFMSAVDYYCQEIDLYIDATDNPNDDAQEQARIQLENRTKLSSGITIAAMGMGAIAKPLANIALKSKLVRNLSEGVAELAIKSGANALKVDYLLSRQIGGNFIDESVKIYKNFNDIPDEVFIRMNDSGESISKISELRLKPPTELTAEERTLLKSIRDTEPAPTSTMLMAKAVNNLNYRKCIDNEYNTIQGFTAKNSSLNSFKTPAEIQEALALNTTNDISKGPIFTKDEIYVIEYTTSDTDKLKIPYSKDYDANSDIIYGVTLESPYTGNGFTGSNDNLIPEYRISESGPNAAKITSGNIYRIDEAGNRELVAFFDIEHIKENGEKGAFIELGDLK
ncbi:MAG: hypothetical protein LBM93_05110, partial [Oscillospiraceae bacterium]|nr:hypothetical protein [Oscillospiraceae bacterium]